MYQCCNYTTMSHKHNTYYILLIYNNFHSYSPQPTPGPEIWIPN